MTRKTKTIWVHSGGECDVCAAMKGKTYDHDPGDVTMHPNCRCVAEPMEVPVEEQPLEHDATGRMKSPRQQEIAEYKEKYGDDVDVSLAKEMEQDFPFHKAMAKIKDIEGGYVNDPDDPGKETKYGITKRYYPAEDIKNLTRERADYILYRDYWKHYRIYKLPDGVRDDVMNIGINKGPGTTIEILQKVLGVEQDGLIGPQTIEASRQMPESEIKRLFKESVNNHYHQLQKNNPKLKKYQGWFNRLNE